MKQVRLRKVHLYLGEKSLGNPNDILKTFLEGEPRYKEVVGLYGRVKGLKGLAALVAHGHVKGKTWFWYDGFNNQWNKVQDWINEYDGMYIALLLNVCNQNVDPSKKGSLILLKKEV